MDTVPDLAAIREAARRISPWAHRTPVLTCNGLDRTTGARLHFKCENFQKMGAFKFRGALNAVQLLPEEAAGRGVVTHSSGNFAQALALAARSRGIPAYIVMPSNAPQVKRRAVADYGGQITLCEPTLDARTETAARIEQRRSAEALVRLERSTGGAVQRLPFVRGGSVEVARRLAGIIGEYVADEESGP